METFSISGNLINLILKAKDADENTLKTIRSALIEFLGKVGAKIFVETAAQILKDNFCIKGCNDVRIPLKRIFSISLEELEESLQRHEFNLPPGHPISILSSDHKENLKKLKALRFSLGSLNLNQDTSSEGIKGILSQFRAYYAELDSHIKKEEEALFSVLEESGMQEHPQNLREEHKNFRDLLLKIAETLDGFIMNKPDKVFGEIRGYKEKFVSDISNHIFRETYIFYPASLEFITDKGQWENIKEKNAADKTGL